MRKKLYSAISKQYITKPYQAKKNPINKPVVYIVEGKATGTLNSYGLSGIWEIVCLHPEDVLELDKMVNNIIKIIRNIPEVEGITDISGDDYDADFRAYMRIITIKIPKGVY